MSVLTLYPKNPRPAFGLASSDEGRNNISIYYKKYITYARKIKKKFLFLGTVFIHESSI